MCVAIYKPKDVILTKRILRQCMDANPHGAGFAYLDNNGHAVIHKNYDNFRAFWRAFREHQNAEAILHFRFATHGPINAANCHPFILPDHGAIVHNGIIDWCCPDRGDQRSDTRIFVDEILIPYLARYDLHDPDFRTTLERAIGPHNKMIAFWHGQAVILNESRGTWHHGAWYSTMSWQWEALWHKWAWDDDQWPFTARAQCEICFKTVDDPVSIGTADLCETCYSDLLGTNSDDTIQEAI